MADSAITRKRRERAHRAGDHGACRPESCVEAPRREPAGVGELEAAVAAYVEGLGLGDGDPRGLTGMVAVRLARHMDGRTTAAMARELRGCLDVLGVDGREDDSQSLAVLRALKELMR